MVYNRILFIHLLVPVSKTYLDLINVVFRYALSSTVPQLYFAEGLGPLPKVPGSQKSLSVRSHWYVIRIRIRILSQF